MRPKRVLVTGAGGFLGCRLVERLLMGEGIPVQAMAHRPAGTARLARLPVEIVWANLADPSSIEQAVAGCDVVVHCAYGTGGIRHADRLVTVDGTRLLAEAAIASGVRRFVHISTIGVYSYSPPPAVTEETPFSRSGDAYCDDKIDAEQIVWQSVRQANLPAAVLRMGNMYGPFSGPWTVRPIDHIRNGYVSLVDEGHHACNALFVDNAVEAILLSINSEASVGQAFFVTDDEMSWRTWFDRYAVWLGDAPLVSIDSRDLRAELHPSVTERLRSVGRDLWSGVFLPSVKSAGQHARKTQSFESVVNDLSRRIPKKWLARIKGDRSGERSGSAGTTGDPGRHPRLLPPQGLLQVYAGRTVFSNEKAKCVLGYGPAVSFDQAAAITEQWARWARLVP